MKKISNFKFQMITLGVLIVMLYEGWAMVLYSEDYTLLDAHLYALLITIGFLVIILIFATTFVWLKDKFVE